MIPKTQVQVTAEEKRQEQEKVVKSSRDSGGVETVSPGGVASHLSASPAGPGA